MEPRDVRLKRMRMRAWHRGIKEMDLILGGWADRNLATADDATLDAFEVVLAEADHDLYQWVSGQAEAPEGLRPFVGLLAEELRGHEVGR
jgi:antitoxin CptB